METLSMLLALLWGESTYYAESTGELLLLEEAVDHTAKLLVIWDASTFMWHHCNENFNYSMAPFIHSKYLPN